MSVEAVARSDLQPDDSHPTPVAQDKDEDGPILTNLLTGLDNDGNHNDDAQSDQTWFVQALLQAVAPASKV